MFEEYEEFLIHKDFRNFVLISVHMLKCLQYFYFFTKF